ncbi:hypothetical protein ACFQ0B_30365 [Nonomuraea thailandensis]
MELAQLRGRFELNSGSAAEAVRILAAGDSLEMLADAAEAASYAGDVAAIVEIGRRASAHPEGFLRDVLTGIGLTLSGGGTSTSSERTLSHARTPAQPPTPRTHKPQRSPTPTTPRTPSSGGRWPGPGS